MGVALLVLLVAVLVVAGFIAYLVTVYNSLVRLKNDNDKAWSNLDVLLKQRHDELPKLIETCKGYMHSEQKTFELIVQARTAYQTAGTVGEKAQSDNMLSGALKNLFAVAENYPELKANNNFITLRKRISELEEKIADRRQYFNDSVNTFNIRIAEIPVSLVAGYMRLQPRQLFQVAAPQARM